jgi:hypothetical protein
LKCKSGENEIMNQCKCGIGVLIDKRTNHKWWHKYTPIWDRVSYPRTLEAGSFIN